MFQKRERVVAEQSGQVPRLKKTGPTQRKKRGDQGKRQTVKWLADKEVWPGVIEGKRLAQGRQGKGYRCW